MDECVYLSALNKCYESSWRKAHELLIHFDNAEKAFKSCNKPFLLEEAAREIDYYKHNNIEIITIKDETYPVRLAQIADAPLVLFSKGTRGLNGKRFLAVVGTRHSTAQAKKYCDMIAEYMSGLKIKPVIVSGLAYGVDSYAHHSALHYGLDTIAVVATGLDYIYPASNKKLAEQIVERGAVITEYWSHTPTYPSNFVNRNRIVAGMCDGTVVVESKEKGGSLITAGAAFAYDRDVFAFPGRADDPAYGGCNILIERNIAHIVTNASSIGINLGWIQTKIQQKSPELFDISLEKSAILEILDDGNPKDAAQIAEICGQSACDVSLRLLELEMDGLVRNISTNKYVHL